MRLLFISMHYAPEPCDTRTSMLARDLAALGHDCMALTSFPNYPFGKIYPGWRQSLVSRQIVDGVSVVRVPMYPDHSRSGLKRAASYLSFMLSALGVGGWTFGRPDLIWIHHPPLTTGIAGALHALLRGVPYVYEVQDVWPDTLVSTGMVSEGRVTRAISRICGWLYQGAASVVVTSDGMKRRLVDQGAVAEKILVIPQWADETIYAPIDRDPGVGNRYGLAGKFNILFAGNVGAAQGLDTALEAAGRLSDLPDFQLVIVGDGLERERLEAETARRGLKNVRFLGHHPALEMPEFYAWSDALLVHLIDDPLFADTIPSKTQVYLASGRPVLCGVAGDAAAAIANTGAGITFRPQDPAAMEQAIRTIYAMPDLQRQTMARRAREGYEERFARSASVARYEELFSRLVAAKRGSRLVGSS